MRRNYGQKTNEALSVHGLQLTLMQVMSFQGVEAVAKFAGGEQVRVKEVVFESFISHGWTAANYGYWLSMQKVCVAIFRPTC